MPSLYELHRDGFLLGEDFENACCFVDRYEPPDVTIAPDGEPYLYRWHVSPRNPHGNVYFHLQVLSDPERPLHDHPWDNQTVILAGGYDEVYDRWPGMRWPGGTPHPEMRKLRKGDVIARKAEEAHRLILPADIPYTMTLFSTGPHRRAWGFWTADGWVDQKELVVELPDGRSVFKGDMT